MCEMVRMVVAVAITPIIAVRQRWFNDDFDEFIADQRQRFIDMAEGL